MCNSCGIYRHPIPANAVVNVFMSISTILTTADEYAIGEELR
jgi:hypothetical protein